MQVILLNNLCSTLSQLVVFLNLLFKSSSMARLISLEIAKNRSRCRPVGWFSLSVMKLLIEMWVLWMEDSDWSVGRCVRESYGQMVFIQIILLWANLLLLLNYFVRGSFRNVSVIFLYLYTSLRDVYGCQKMSQSQKILHPVP